MTRRRPAVLFKGASDISVIRTGSLGFAGAAEGDRLRWINSFRRLLDGLDGPLQVLIEVVPGAGSASSREVVPLDFDDMRGADTSFVERLDNLNVMSDPGESPSRSCLVFSGACSRSVRLPLA